MNDNLLDQNSGDNETIDTNKNYLQELVGEGKKFKSPEELARGKAESDLYIKHLERGRDELREDYLKLREESVARQKLEELIGQLESKTQQPTPSADTQKPDGNIQPQYDSKAIESLVSSKIQEHELTRKQEQNFNAVRAKLQERFGTNYQASLKTQIDSLGLTEDFINDLARKHPTVLFKTLGIDAPVQRENFQSPPRSDQSSNSFSPQTNKRTWNYYQNLKNTSPKVYWDPKTQVQMMHDSVQLGDEFKDGDYERFGRE